MQVCMQAHYGHTAPKTQIASAYSEARSLVCGQVCYFLGIISALKFIVLWPSMNSSELRSAHFYYRCLPWGVFTSEKFISMLFNSPSLNCACSGNPNMVRQPGPRGSVEMWDNKTVIPSRHAVTPQADTEVQGFKPCIFLVWLLGFFFVLFLNRLDTFPTKSSSISGSAHIGRFWDEN